MDGGVGELTWLGMLGGGWWGGRCDRCVIRSDEQSIFISIDKFLALSVTNYVPASAFSFLLHC